MKADHFALHTLQLINCS